MTSNDINFLDLDMIIVTPQGQRSQTLRCLRSLHASCPTYKVSISNIYTKAMHLNLNHFLCQSLSSAESSMVSSVSYIWIGYFEDLHQRFTPLITLWSAETIYLLFLTFELSIFLRFTPKPWILSLILITFSALAWNKYCI